MEITEKWLSEIGGWQAMKAARSLVEAGFVTVTKAESGLVKGLAGGGKSPFAAGLAFKSLRDVENLCTCPTARRGLICEHGLAVVLQHLRQLKGGTSQATGGGRSATGPAPDAAPSRAMERQKKGISPPSLSPLQVPGEYSVFWPEPLLAGGLREPVSLYLRYVAAEKGGSGEESRLAAWLAKQGVRGQSAPLALSGQHLMEFLQMAAEHPRLFVGKPSNSTPQGISLAAQAVRLPLQARALQGDGAGVEFRLLAEHCQPLLRQAPLGYWLCRETSSLFPVPVLNAECAALLKELPTRRPLRWLIAQRAALAEAFQLEFSGPGLEPLHCVPVPCEMTLHLEGSLNAVEATLKATFRAHEWNVGETGARSASEAIFPLLDEKTEGLFYLRNEAEEARAMGLLEEVGFQLTTRVEGQGASLVWKLTKPDAVLQLYATELPRIRREMKVVEGERWRVATKGLARITPQVSQVMEAGRGGADGGSRSGQDWLTMEFHYSAPDGFRLPRQEVLRLIRSGQKSVTAKNGKRYLLDLASVEEFEDTLRDVPVQLTPEGARVSQLHADYFFPEQESGRGAVQWTDESALRARLGPLGERLRPYQWLGARWLVSLAEQGRGGVLGDEMGLGKTVQSIATICALYAEAAEPREPTLIVCPKSLTGNWKAEFESFAPHLRAIISQGQQRGSTLQRLAEHDVIITTYQLAVRDQEVLQKVRWKLVLLDEASYIRNPDTDAAKALRSLQARSRLALTGTPVENSARDLWSIYHFALPGYLGSREQFKERFEGPLATAQDSPAGRAASERLKKLLRPYFLRRSKREVLKDLPEKIEQVLWCDPTPEQAEVYRRVLEEGREEIKLARKRSGQKGAKMTMFTVLLRLRQTCCDLRLTGLPESALDGLSPELLSGKWSMLQERLEAILEGGGKVLIFSQFVQFLKLVRADLDARDLSYAYLDGSSNDREAQVRTFQKQAECRIFLISLKAGGYGLNLTAADHVMLLDPWWNPAVEAQAIDRAHRIGQQRVVTAYRLALRGTVEERILALQKKKRGLVEATLDENTPLMAGLDEGELESLLSDEF